MPAAAPATADDAALVARALARDEAAVRAILLANNRRLYRLARGILCNDGEAEDVVQETYVRAFSHLAEFRGESSLSTWLSRIAMNEALGRLRRARPAVELSTLSPGALEARIVPFPLASAAADPERAMAQREIRDVVEETADILGLKPETVKTRLHRARALLRRNVEKRIGPVILEAFPFAGRRCERLTGAVLRRLGFP